MSEKGSVFQKGGGGTNFEQLVQTAFLTTLIVQGNVPSVNSGKLSEVALQVTNRGYETDDFMATVKSANSDHHLLIQVKHDISFTADNKKFQEVINGFWKDFNNLVLFNKTKDKLIIVKNGLTKDERNHLKSLFNWAIYHASETDFITEVNRIKGKKSRLDIFRKVLKEANQNRDLTDKEIWEFLKCLDVLEYDFLNEGSVDKSYFLNLINLSKSQNSTASAIEIWDSIFAYISNLNPNGGSVTLESIKEQHFFKHFDNNRLNPYFKAVDKLKSDSNDILQPMKTVIGISVNNFHLPRIKNEEKILEALSCSQFTIVTGKPGVGKSAQIKDILERDFSNSNVFVFRADQFNEPTIANVFSNLGINEKIKDIFSCISLINNKIIFIDSLEKLLEADPECAFKQLLAYIKKDPEIKIIASSRKYAIDLITIKFGIDKKDTNIIEIPPFNEEELELVTNKFPQLINVLKNSKIKKLLQSPKYLDFSISAIKKTNDDYSNISSTEFKDKLWNALVVNSTTRIKGLPAKREKAFMEIAVKRAKEMKLFTQPINADEEAIDYLENDEIIFQENNNRRYSPTHDILEDWALVKYISSKFDENPKPKDLFDNLGTEPAIRRAFRLWVEDYLVDNSKKIHELIKATILDTTIEKYWADELLVAIFKSDNSSSFFSTFQQELLNNNSVFFNRCLHLIKTCCKESDEREGSTNFLLPIGSGWAESIFFIKKNINQLNFIKFSVINFLTDWYYKLILQYEQIDKKELISAKFIVLNYINEIEAGKEAQGEEEFWEDKIVKEKSSDLIMILFELASISKDEITKLVERAFISKKNQNAWQLNSFYKEIIKKCLSGTGSQRFIKELPDLIVETAWKNWKYVPPKKEEIADSRFGIFDNVTLRDEQCWGIKDKDFFPAGIYKTPFYRLMCAHPMIGVKFIIDFINYSVDFYVNNTCSNKQEISEIRIELNDGTIINQWGSWELWAAYRGLSVTNYALESLLVSLEKFLLLIAELKTDRSSENLKYIFNYILQNSNNIAPLAVLTSVTIAFPNEVEEMMLPILSVKEFYEWDLQRSIRETTVVSPFDVKIPIAQNERGQSNKLPHRQKYRSGLADFILEYQFNNGKLNIEIFKIFDKLQLQIKDNNLGWKKRLNEIDTRKWKVHAYDEKLGGYPIKPIYEEDVAQHLASNQGYIETHNKSITYSTIISKAYDKTEIIDYEKWKECFIYYFQLKDVDPLFDHPITLANLGLSEFSKELLEEEKKWCLETLFYAIEHIIEDTFNPSFNFDRNINLTEKSIALSSLHLLMENAENSEHINGLVGTMIYILIAPFNDYDLDNAINYLREIFFKKYPEEAKRVWLGLLNYSEFLKRNPFPSQLHHESSLKSVEQHEKFIKKISSHKNLKFDMSTINFQTHKESLLVRAFKIIPYTTIDIDFIDFIEHFIKLLVIDLLIEEPTINKTHKKQITSKAINIVKYYLAEFLLKVNIKVSKSVLNIISAPIFENNSLTEREKKNLFEFTLNVQEQIIYKLDDIITNSNDKCLKDEMINNFWLLWEYLFDEEKKSKQKYFISKILLDIRWKETATHWEPLENRKDFYELIMKELGKNSVSSIVNIFSTIGEKTFLPDSLTLLVEILKAENTSNIVLSYGSAESLIKRLFYNHITKIKKNKILIDDYIWILNQMVDFGSSHAYLFRENVITYKSI